MEVVQFIYNEQTIDFQPIGKDNVMVNATQMAKVFGKRVENFTRIESTQSFITECLKNANQRILNIVQESDLVVSKQNSGTWMHRILALKFAAWLDPAFELWVFSTIDKIILGYYREVRNASEEKIQAEQLLITKKKAFLEKHPEYTDILELEARVNAADRRRLKALRDDMKQLKLDLFPELQKS